MKRRLLSLLMVLALILGTLPAALADDLGQRAGGDSWSSEKVNGMQPVGDLASLPLFPTDPDDAMMAWSVCAGLYGSGVGSNGEVTNPVYMDEYLYIIGGEGGKQQILKIDPADGTVLKRVDVHGQGGFYYFLRSGGGKLYFRGNGYVQAFDKELNSLWVYEAENKEIGDSYAGAIVYDDGYIYFGTAATRTFATACFFCIDAANGSLVWKYEAELNYTDHISKAGAGNYWGFYWANPCVIGGYVLCGSDGGRLYCTNKKTGDIVQRLDVGEAIYGAEGTDKYKSFIRSGIIYDESTQKIYFTSTDGYVHMADVDVTAEEPISNHKFALIGTAAGSGGNGSLMGGGPGSTSTPAIANGRLYVGASDCVSVFNANTLEKIYSTPHTLSKARDIVLVEDKSTGDVYLFTSYYDKPGSILMMVDKDEQAETSGYLDFKDVTSEHVQNNATSPIFGPDGTIYCTNDLGYLMAIQKASAYLEALSSDQGEWGETFVKTTTSYHLVLPVEMKTFNLTFQANEGSTVTVDGKAVTGTVPVTLGDDGTAQVQIRVSQSGQNITYTVDARTVYTDTSAAMITTTNNGIASGAVSIPLYEGAEDIFVVTRATSGTRTWMGAVNSEATVGNIQILTGDTSQTSVSSNNVYEGITYPVRLWKSAAVYPVIASFDVTAENGDKQTYYVLITDEAAYDETSATPLKLELDQTELTLSDETPSGTLKASRYMGETAINGAVTWASSDPNVVSVSQDGTVKAVSPGTAEITASSGGVSASCTVTSTATAAPTVTAIAVTTPPTKTAYAAGETFDPAGMVVTATYSNGTSAPTASYTCTPQKLSAGDTAVTITYTGDDGADALAPATQAITVSAPTVTAIAITTPPTKTAYTAGETFDPTGMVVTATYSNGTSAPTTSYTCTPQKLSVGDTAVTITYTGDDGADALAPVTQAITVKTEGNNPNTPSERTITAYVSYSEEGKFVRGNGTLLCNVPVTVKDSNKDGIYTMGEAFAAFHETYYSGGKSGYTEDTSSTGGWVSKFWGDSSGNISFVLNHNWVPGSKTEISSGDQIDVFSYYDISGYSDLYTWFDQKSYSATANTEKSFTVNGLSVMQSDDRQAATAAPEGASVTVYDRSGKALSELSTKTDSRGSFSITFPSAGSYTVEVSGTCDYTCAGYGGGSTSSRGATVVPARCTVSVSAGNTSNAAGGGGGAGTGEKTENVVKPDVTADKNGVATVTVSEKNLTDSINQAKTDKSNTVVIAPEVKGDASKVSAELPKSGVDSLAKQTDVDLTVQTSIANITIRAEGLEDLSGRTGRTVTVSAESVKGVGTVRLEIAVDGKAVDRLSGGIAVSVPAGAEKAGNVLVLVNADGTETVVKKSAADGKTMAALLDGSCTVKVMDNAKTFDDTVSHWGKDAIAFASSHELFNGISANEFAPNATMSRAMLATVLYRLEDAKADGTTNFADVPSNTWYTEAVAWANENGIVKGTGDGFNPNGNVTREQLATMLYRCAQVVGMDTTTKGSLNKFSDNSKTSNWAQDAMSWAVGCGLIFGKDSNTLDPTGSATRAEVATIMQRMVGLMVK